MNQKLKIRAYLMQNFLELDMKEFSDPKGGIFEIWSLKTKGHFGPKPLAKGFIKPLVENPCSNFDKQDLIFSRIMR